MSRLPTPREFAHTASGHVPCCPEVGHEDTQVARFGVYAAGGGPRQRYRCTPRTSASTHYFSLPVTLAPPSSLPAWSHRYPVEQVARALLAIGHGASYRQASINAIGGSASLSPVRPDGQQVARWIDRFGPAVLSQPAPVATQPGPGLLGLGAIPSSARCCALLLATWHDLGSGRMTIHAVGAAPLLAPSQWASFLARIEVEATTPVVVDASSADACEPLRGRRARIMADSAQGPPRLDPGLDVEAHGCVADEIRIRTAELVARYGSMSARFRLVRDATRRGILLELARQELNGSASIQSYCAALTTRSTTQ